MLLFTLFILGLSLFANLILLRVITSESRQSLTRMIFAVYVSCITLWTAGILLNLWLESIIIERFIFAIAALGLTSQLWFVIIYPNGMWPKNIAPYIALMLGIIFALLSFIDGAMFHTLSVTSFGYTIIDTGFLSGYYSLFALCYVIAPVAILIKKYRDATETVFRQQLFFLSIGFSVFVVINVLTNSLLPVFFDIYFFNAIGPVFSLVLAAFIMHIIGKYHFLNIRVIIQRGIIYTTLLIITVGCYLLFVSLLGYLFQKTTSATILFSAGITMLFGIWGTPFIERYFRKHTDRFFFRDTYNFAEATRELVQIGNTNINLEKIVHESRLALARILKSEHVTFIFVSDAVNAHHEKMKSLSKLYAETHHGVHQAALVFQHGTYSQPPHKKQSPMQENPEVRELGRVCQAELGFLVALENKLIGLLFIGKKHSGKPYEKMDLDLLENFSSQIAVAAEKALLYKQVAEYSLQLEERVSERTREIEKLRETEKQMMLDISHGLQTPLTILKGELEKLKRAAPDSSEFGSLEQSIDVASKFVYDLLRLARLERIKETQRESFNLSHLMEELVEYIEVVAHQRSISINAKIMDGCMMLGDAKELQEAFTNLMSNAIKYTKSDPTHKALIEISLTYNDSSASIYITDNGDGIPEKDIPHLFERFYRSQHNQSKKGTGLGLAITKSIIERHGGDITVTSMIGKGTSFFITLPLVGSAK